MPQGLLTDGTHLPRARLQRELLQTDPGLKNLAWVRRGGRIVVGRPVGELSALAEGSGAVGLELQVCVCVYTCAHTHVF